MDIYIVNRFTESYSEGEYIDTLGVYSTLEKAKERLEKEIRNKALLAGITMGNNGVATIQEDEWNGVKYTIESYVVDK